ncbi:MAG: hypothetical protein L0220_26040 [Acidobacteria bacterium]|nr:hypothetical protein [Acidobacteriota bacterium]
MYFFVMTTFFDRQVFRFLDNAIERLCWWLEETTEEKEARKSSKKGVK